MKTFFVLLATLAINVKCFAESELIGKVTNVIDGNTIEMVAQDNETYKVLLFGIDCPEIGQEFADKARKNFWRK